MGISNTCLLALSYNVFKGRISGSVFKNLANFISINLIL